MRRAISARCGVSVASTPRNQSSARRIERSAACARFDPAMRTASASGFSRAPWQTAQGFFRLVAAHLLPDPGRIRLRPAALQVHQHALERLGHAVGADFRPL